MTAASAVVVAIVAPSQASAAPDTSGAQGAPQSVIVVMRDQHPDLKPKVQAEQRAKTVAGDQQSVVDDLKGHGATDLVQLNTVSAVAAKAKPADIQRLRANPAVAAVVPDLTIYPNAHARSATPKDTTPKPSQQICPADPAKPLLEPEALDITRTESQDPGAVQAHSLATGKGIKAAVIADGLDPSNPDFIRPDGSRAIVDYQDFSGDGLRDSSGGGEAFGDASSIVSQGSRTYDLSTELPYAGLPRGCTFRLRGMAPDAQLVAIKVFGQNGSSTSGFVRGIDYAVNHDKVDILSESFGGNPYPDPDTDPITLADRAAINAGVTVVASSGDSGVSGTVGSPASDPRVIAAAGSTSYRLLAQAYGYKTWVNNNITGLSSGGPTLNNKVVDLVAPAMAGMADCTVDPRWDDCTGLTETFGGTSQSAPLVAGAAALVMEAYERTHHGVRPSPDLVKRLLTGTATDLNVPADQQGSGLLDSYSAVRAALSVRTDDGRPTTAAGTALLPSVSQLDLTGNAGDTQNASVTLTNTGSAPQTVTATSRTEGAQTSLQDRTVPISASAANPTPAEGAQASAPVTFTVSPGTPLLDMTMVWPGTKSSGPLAMLLVDPQGRLVQESYDYKFTNYQFINVHDPIPGTWTVKILWANGRAHLQEPPLPPGTFAGNAQLRIVGHDYASAGVTGTTRRVIPAGGSATFDLRVPLPASAGDVPASIQFDSDAGQHLSLPVSRRALIPTKANGDNAFSTTITGGVGRVLGQEKGFYLDVPAGRRSMTVDLTAPDPGTALEFYLVSPDKQLLSGDVNATEATWNDKTSAQPTGTSSLTVREPAAGRWQLLVVLTNAVSGKEFSEQLTGKVRFDAVNARANNLPDGLGTKIKSGTTTTGSIEVTNAGVAGQYFFLDPRLAGQSTVDLKPYVGDTTLTLPLHTSTSTQPSWIVPPHTSKLAATASATMPVDLDLYNDKGNPEIFARAPRNGGNTTTVVARAKQLALGSWTLDVQQPGPFPNGSAAGSATVSLSAETQAFDPWTTSETGDYWQRAVGGPAATPVYVAPGVSRSIRFSITPTAPVGTQVHGMVYVNTVNPLAGSGSELVGIPYSYTVS
ncbi:S8 family serine peptidase [Solihabitans fulvus]|uniref:S8 family serine peptidase n=1 Tax=Solihabitans fulvus TaxID=1892852 RepID=A0A5B2XWC9_9PSEU|nr:S8 family serine peptidase [Solihabitans fulvus]